jgi:hypothetical protein
MDQCSPVSNLSWVVGLLALTFIQAVYAHYRFARAGRIEARIIAAKRDMARGFREAKLLIGYGAHAEAYEMLVTTTEAGTDALSK